MLICGQYSKVDIHALIPGLILTEIGANDELKPGMYHKLHKPKQLNL